MADAAHSQHDVSSGTWPEDPLALPADLEAKGLQELGETPQVRREALRELRAKLEAEIANSTPKRTMLRPHRTDDQYLLAFLRPQKFRVDVALQKLRAYTAFKEEHRDILTGMRAEDFRGMLELGFLRPLKKLDQEGRSVICMFPAKMDPERLPRPEVLIMWTIFCIEQTGVMFDPYFQVNGVVIVEDLAGFSVLKVFQSMGGRLKRAQDANFKFMREACPYRLKGMFIVNEPVYMDIILAIVSPFMSAKLMSRIRLLGREIKGLKALHTLVSPECLPPEFGGTLQEKPLEVLEHFMELERQGRTVSVF